MKTAVKKEMTGRALSLIGGAARIGGVFGPLLGGLIISYWSVRWALATQVRLSMCVCVCD
jgi:MFS family permease